MRVAHGVEHVRRRGGPSHARQIHTDIGMSTDTVGGRERSHRGGDPPGDLVLVGWRRLTHGDLELEMADDAGDEMLRGELCVVDRELAPRTRSVTKALKLA